MGRFSASLVFGSLRAGIFVVVLLLICLSLGQPGEAKDGGEGGDKEKDDISGIWTNWEPEEKSYAWVPPKGSSSTGIPLAKPQSAGKSKKTSTKATDEKKQSNNITGAGEPMDLKEIREKVFSLGKFILDFVTGSDFGGAGNFGLGNFFPAAAPPGGETGRSGRSLSIEGNRGVIDWLARLLGVSGKTLGEFLREYQVHVLYDLVFTFFKWIFFLYAGLLIP